MQTDEVRSRQDLARYLATLAEDVRTERIRSEHSSPWEYIDAAGRWVADMDGYYANRGELMPTEPNWKLIASIFAAAVVYE